MKQALFFAFGLAVGALGLLPMLRAEAAPAVADKSNSAW